MDVINEVMCYLYVYVIGVAMEVGVAVAMEKIVALETCTEHLCIVLT